MLFSFRTSVQVCNFQPLETREHLSSVDNMFWQTNDFLLLLSKKQSTQDVFMLPPVTTKEILCVDLGHRVWLQLRGRGKFGIAKLVVSACQNCIEIEEID